MSIREKLAKITADMPKVYEAGVAQGTAEGKQAEYDAFWDAFQEGGKRVSYNRGFGGQGWNDETFKPKHPISPSGNSSAYMMFCQSRIADAFRANSITIDFSGVRGDMVELFANCTNLVYVPILDVSNIGRFQNCFAYCSKLVTIEKLVISDVFSFSTSFTDCRALENITIEGELASNGLDVHWSTLLSKASITSIVNALSTTTSGLTVTLSKTAVDAAFGADEWAALIATRPNWTIALA